MSNIFSTKHNKVVSVDLMRSFFRAVVCLCFILTVQFNYGQDDGPGGVGTSSNMAVWLDPSSLSFGNGDDVDTWDDISGNGNDFSQGVVAERPVFVSSSSLNGKPAVYFDGTDDHIQSNAIGMLDGTRATWFTVTQLDAGSMSPSKNIRYILETHYDNFSPNWRHAYIRDNITKSRIVGSARKSGGSFLYTSREFATSDNDEAYISAWSLNTDNSVYLYVNGDFTSNSAADGAIGNHTTTNLGNVLNSSVQYFQGVMGDVIIYNEQLNDAQSIIIQNYLAGKYNITLDASFTRYDHGSTHSYDVAGIGREDASNEHLSAQGTGIVSMTSAGLDDGDYIMWGHDNAGTTTSTTNTPAAYSATNGNRLDQEWIVTETGEVGTVTITIDLTGIEFGFDDEYELLVNDDGDGDFSDASRYTGTPAGSILTFSLDAAELQDGARFTCGNTQETIISVQDGQNWNVSSTWSCSCIPGGQNNVIIDDGHSVTVNDGEATNDLTINATGELVIDNGGDFEISGNVDSDGTFSVNQASKISLNGTAAQTLDFAGTVAFDTLEVDNSSGVDFNTGTFTFSGSLLPTDGDLSFGANSVTFLSSASGTASIGPQGDIAQVITMTNVTSQRFIAAGSAGWREVGFPFNADYKLSDWDDEVYISGPAFPDGCAYNSDGCFTSVKYWGGVRMQGITSVDSVINAGTGVDFYLGDNLNTFSAHTLQTTKSLNLTFEQIIPLSSDWNFIANPFLSPIDFDNITLNGADNYFWVYDPATDGWQFYEPGGSPETFSANLAGGIISAYQGFWVFNPGGVSPEIVIDQSAKSVASSDAFLKAPQLLKSNCFTIKIDDKLQETTSSRLYIDIDGKRKSIRQLPKLHDELLMSVAYQGHDYSILSLKEQEECLKLPLSIEGVVEGYYTFDFSNVPEFLDVVFANTKTGHSRYIDSDKSLEIYLTEDNKDDFYLVLKGRNSDCSLNENPDLAFLYENNEIYVRGLVGADQQLVTYNLFVYDLSGKLILNEMSFLEGNQLKVPAQFTSGCYLVEVRTVDGKKIDTGKIVVAE